MAVLQNLTLSEHESDVAAPTLGRLEPDSLALTARPIPMVSGTTGAVM